MVIFPYFRRTFRALWAVLGNVRCITCRIMSNTPLITVYAFMRIVEFAIKVKGRPPTKKNVYFQLDLSDGQFSERCDVDGSFFNSDAIPIIFGKT